MAKASVLVIDDSYQTQQMLADLVLRPIDYEPIAALDGEEGLQLAIQGMPALIVLDLHLPGMGGLEVLEALRRQGTDTPVIVISEHESTESVIQAFKLGVADYVVKPLDPEEMQELVRRALAGAELRAERDHLTQQLLETNEKLHEQLQELNAIYTIGRSVTSLLDLDRVLHRVVEAATHVTEAEEGLLLLADERNGGLYLRAAKGADERLAQNLRMHVDDSAAGRAVQTGRPVCVAGERTRAATGDMVRALLYVPLQIAERGVIGVLGVTNRESARSFSERDVFLLSALGDYAAIAIENARLFEVVQAERVKLEAVLREAKEAIVVVDGDSNVVVCSDAALDVLGLAGSDVLRKPIDEAIPHPAVRQMFVQARDTNQVVHSEVTLDDERTFNAQLTPVEGVGQILVMQEITHLKELDRLRSDFVTAVSHDLRTPLTTIQGYIELLSRAGPLNDEQQGFIEHARKSIVAVTELVGDLLAMGRIEAGFDIEMRPCSLVDIIEEAIEPFRPQVRERRQELRWEAPSTHLLVRGNPRTLRQVMENLISNAVKYTPEGGRITISVDAEDEHTVVRVTDTGIGIPAVHQPYIFDKFYRIESEETAGVEGTGLGLAIVRTVVEKHNGRVWVESKPGEGSTFSFVLPALKEGGA